MRTDYDLQENANVFTGSVRSSMVHELAIVKMVSISVDRLVRVSICMNNYYCDVSLKNKK